MRPLRLRLEGFGSYRHPAEADFSDVSFFALTGPTGAGKSTLIDGLCFALYGTVPRWGKENVIAQALAPAASACRVGLVFEAGGKRYAAVRALARDRKGQVHTREARLDLLDPAVPAGAPLESMLAAASDHLAEGPEAVKAKVQEILGLSYEHFTQSVLLPQGRFSDFLQAEPRRRQDLLVELLAFGIYEQVGQRARRRAEQAADRRQNAERERAELAAATAEAEEQAAARVRALNSLSQTVDERSRDLRSDDEQARQAAGQADEARKRVSLLATVRVPSGVAGLADRIAAADRLLAVGKKQADDAARAEEEAERARGALPGRDELEALARAYDQHRELTAKLERQEAELAASRDHASVLDGQRQAAEREAKLARAAREEAERAHAAYALAEGLRAGQPCPVCRQPVTTLPSHPPPPGLDQVRTAADAAVEQLTRAQEACIKASNQVAAAQATVRETRRQLDSVTATLAGAPSADEVASTLRAISTADEVLRKARENTRARQRELRAAEKERHALAGEEALAWEDLHRARDPVAGLGAPAIQANDLAATWTTLAGWAQRRHAQEAKRLADLETAASALRQRVAAGTQELRSLLAAHGITGVSDPDQAPAAVATHRARAEGDLAAIGRDRQRAAKLEGHIRECREEEQVATELGRLLRATSFERWLCSEALDSLVAEASETLSELSGGQYELDRDPHNDLVVIDYHDAAARRPVHTLSGGETFQASLALALALSRQVVRLSAGMRDLNSMFLDEGFGTLDPESLDTVAATLERLAADSDRMVGLVTHVAALAERVPVRFVVSRDGGSSTLRKERV
jgi:exonuclease SbcC